MNIESVISENINSFHKNIFTPPNLKKNSYNIDSFLNNRSGSNMSHQRSPFAIQELLGLGPGGDSAGTPPQHRGPTTGVNAHTPGGHNIGSCGELNKIFINIMQIFKFIRYKVLLLWSRIFLIAQILCYIVVKFSDGEIMQISFSRRSQVTLNYIDEMVAFVKMVFK